MMNYYLVEGEAVEEVMDKMFDDPANIDEIKQIEWDSFREGITSVCIKAETITEAADIAKKFYGFKNCNAQKWTGFC